MGIEIAEEKGVRAVEKVEDGSDVEVVAWRTGGDGRDVAVENVGGGVGDVDADADDFERRVVVGERGGVDVSKIQRVVDESHVTR